MSSLAEPRRCARGPQCKVYDSDKNLSAKLSRDTEGVFCRDCRKEHAGWYKTSSSDRWMDKVTQAIERVFKQRPTPQRPYKATLLLTWTLTTVTGRNTPTGGQPLCA